MRLVRTWATLLSFLCGLSVAHALPPPDTDATEKEWATGNPNNTFSDTYTKDLGLLPARAELFGMRVLIPSGIPQGFVSPDYYRFTLNAETTVHATLQNWGIDYDSNARPVIGIFPQSNPLFPLIESSTAVGPGGNYQTLSATLPAGNYAIGVSGTHFDDDGYFWNGGLSYNWIYELVVGTTGPHAPANSFLDRDWRGLGKNDTLLAAQPMGALPAFSTIHGVRYQSMTGGVTPDFYSFSVAVQTQVEIHLNTWGLGYVLDNPVVGIFNAGGNQALPPLHESARVANPSRTAWYQRLVAVLPPGNYVLGVTGFDHDDDDYWLVGGISYDWPYEVEIQATPTPVPPRAVPSSRPWATLLSVVLLGVGFVLGLRAQAPRFQRA